MRKYRYCLEMRKTFKGCVLRPRLSRFVQIFRTTPAQTVCPNFYVLAHASGCRFEPLCSYCYLKSSFWFLRGRRQRQVFINVEKMEMEIRRWIDKDNLESYVLNTGNLSDSLAFETARPLMARLVELFRVYAERRQRPHTLLVVTKGGWRECTAFLRAEPCANVVISFSVNSAAAARRYEKGAPPPRERLAVARHLRAKGWRVRIRLDPMIAGYNYRAAIRQIRDLRPERVTLGTLRAEANLDRYAPPGIFAQLAPAANPKALRRYPPEVRLALYRPAVKALRRICPLGLCEETPEIWRALGLDTEAKTCNCGA